MKKTGSRILLAAVPLAFLNICVNGIPRSWHSLNRGPWGLTFWAVLLTLTAGLALLGTWAVSAAVRQFRVKFSLRHTALALTGALVFLPALGLIWMVAYDLQGPASALGWGIALARAGDTSMLLSSLRIAGCSWAGILAVVAAMLGGALVGCAKGRKTSSATALNARCSC